MDQEHGSHRSKGLLIDRFAVGGIARRDKQVVAQPVQVDRHGVLTLAIEDERYDRALRSAADSSSNVQRGRGESATG